MGVRSGEFCVCQSTHNESPNLPPSPPCLLIRATHQHLDPLTSSPACRKYRERECVCSLPPPRDREIGERDRQTKLQAGDLKGRTDGGAAEAEAEAAGSAGSIFQS